MILRFIALAAVLIAGGLAGLSLAGDARPPITLTWKDNILTLHDARLPGGKLRIWYLEAYCRPGSTDRQWEQTVIGHHTELISRSEDGRRIELRCTLKDGVTVRHLITASSDEVDFQLTAGNPTGTESRAHWAQPCIRVGEFTGHPDTLDGYVPRCFVFLEGKLSMMPTRDWATKARYVPGQVWAAPGVSRNDVNPRPLNPHTPSFGLIGCFSADEKWILAAAWQPYQELFQGVIRCIHSDFRIGGLEPGQTKRIHGKLYLVPNDVPALLKRYQADFLTRHD